jgi:hypothetical protein
MAMARNEPADPEDVWTSFRHFVNQYLLEGDAAAGMTAMTFATEAIENGPPGWRARTTLEFTSPDAFRESFDLSGADGDWTCLITIDLHRVAPKA